MKRIWSLLWVCRLWRFGRVESGRWRVLFRWVRRRVVMEWEVLVKVWRLVWVLGLVRIAGDG